MMVTPIHGDFGHDLCLQNDCFSEVDTAYDLEILREFHNWMMVKIPEFLVNPAGKPSEIPPQSAGCKHYLQIQQHYRGHMFPSAAANRIESWQLPRSRWWRNRSSWKLRRGHRHLERAWTPWG